MYVCSGHHYDGVPGCKFGALHCWNGDLFGENGGSYRSDFWRETVDQSENGDKSARELLDQDYALPFSCALNTFEKSAEVGCYHTGLPVSKRLWPWLTFNKIQLLFSYDYNADDFGRVKKTFVHLQYLSKDEWSGQFSIVKTMPFSTFKWLLFKFNRKVKYARKNSDPGKRMNLLLEAYAKSENTDWIYRLFHSFIKILHPFESRRVLEHFGIKEFPTSWEAHKLINE